MSKYKYVVLNEFNTDLNCPVCEMITEHHVQKIDEEGNGEYIGYFAKCDICECIEDYSVTYFEKITKDYDEGEKARQTLASGKN